MSLRKILFFIPLFVWLGCTNAPQPVNGGGLTSGVDLAPGDKRATAVIFVSPDCPCSTSHEPVLKSLAVKYPAIRFVGVYAGPEDARTKAHFAKANFPFSLIYDPKYLLADELGALKTPHAFVLDRDRKILYQGGVDDTHDARKATEPYLDRALASVIAGKDPNPREVRTLGCYLRK